MKELTLKATLESLPQVTSFIEEQLEALDCPMKAMMQINVAIDEMFGNIVRYAYAPGTGDATVRFDFDEQSRTASITFMDQGVPFNPLENAVPDITLSAEKREIGGLGIFLVRKTMDSMEYRRADGFNMLTIKRSFDH